MPTQTRQTDLNSAPKPQSEDANLTTTASSNAVAATGEGSEATEHPSKVTGQYHSMKGSVVEVIGNTTGSQEWKEAGKREHEQGQRELEDAEQLFPIE